MKLIKKLAIPQICILICLSIIGFAVIAGSFTYVVDRYIQTRIDDNVSALKKRVEFSSERTVEEASLFADLPVVKEAYGIALSGDIDDPYSPQSKQARDLLKQSLAPMMQSYEAINGKRMRLHFHLPNGHSLARVWRESNALINGEDIDISDDISGFRSTVVNTNATGEVTTGIEPVVDNFSVCGVVPIFADDGSQLGSVEVMMDINLILESLNESYGTYMNQELLVNALALQDRELNPQIGEFIQVSGISDPDAAELITAEFLASGRNSNHYERYKNGTLAVIPLQDYQGNQSGLIVLALDTRAVTTITVFASHALAVVLAAMVILPFLALLLQVRALISRPLKKMSGLIQDITEDRADLSTKLPTEQNDEIGFLAGRFNNLVARLSNIINDRKSMADKINSESERFEAMAHWYSSILDCIPMPISVQSNEKHWLFINKAAEELLGRKRKDVIGLKCCENAGFGTCNTEQCAASCLHRGIGQTYFVYEGSSYQVNVSQLTNMRGEISGYIEVIQDITQLEQLRSVAEAESRAKSNFLSTMSHEMRTPLNAIIGMTTIGKKSDERSRKDYALERISESSTHLLGVINDILDMSKIEANKLELSPVPFKPQELLQKVMSVIGYRILEKHQELQIRVDEAVPECLVGDDQRLTQIIINLLTNSIKFTPEGGKLKLGIDVLEEVNGIYELKFTVEDNGIGISNDEKDKLFGAFTQAGNGISRKFGGTGLGLAISKSLVEMMSGRIWAHSVLGEGSSFMFSVKMPCCDKFRENNATEADIFNDNYNEFAGKTMLLAEDMEINREIVIALLEGSGIKIDLVENGEEALLAVADAPNKYDIVFMDVQMPVMDGLEATRRIRNIPLTACKNIPIIAITANVFKDDIQSCLDAGMNGHLAKPIDLNVMTEILRKYLSA